MTNFKLAEALPVPALIAFVLFAAFPAWQTSFVVIGAFAFIGFKAWLTETRQDEMKRLSDELEIVKNRIDAIHLGKSLGHHR